MPSYSDLKCLQKVNAKCPQISDFFAPLKNNFWLFIKGAKKSEIWGHLPSAGTFNQNLRVFTFWGYLQRAMTVYFWDEVFSLRIWGHFIQQCGLDTCFFCCITWLLKTKCLNLDFFVFMFVVTISKRRDSLTSILFELWLKIKNKWLMQWKNYSLKNADKIVWG